MEKFETLATKIDSEFLKIRKELKEMRDGRKDNHASQIYMKDDTPMCEPHEANYVQGYHDRNSKILYSNQNRNPNCHYPYLRNRMPHPSKSFELPKTSMEEMMREWMTRQMETNERMKNHVVELERKIKQGIKKPSSGYRELGEAVRGDVKFIEEDKINPIPTKPKPNPIISNSPTVSPFRGDCTLHITYTNAKTSADDVFLNNVGDKKLKSVDGVGYQLAKIKKVKDGESIESYYSRFYKIMDEMVRNKLKVDTMQQHQNEVNEICAKKIARNANPLVLVVAAQHYPDKYSPDTYYQALKPYKTYTSSSRHTSSTSSHATTLNKSKEIAKPITPPSESPFDEYSDPEHA
ncbi:hypothetical protein Tco_1003532 [Tanacetum coccineum]|uniref:Retrotransposon gag domain-containing protein n=1 Tax=Tanacetum coccineum TaxID=301880 RepID=A0ABQ5F9Y9_9ASTR